MINGTIFVEAGIPNLSQSVLFQHSLKHLFAKIILEILSKLTKILKLNYMKQNKKLKYFRVQLLLDYQNDESKNMRSILRGWWIPARNLKFK